MPRGSISVKHSGTTGRSAIPRRTACGFGWNCWLPTAEQLTVLTHGRFEHTTGTEPDDRDPPSRTDRDGTTADRHGHDGTSRTLPGEGAGRRDRGGDVAASGRE
jgi:hypothetical protein